MAGAFLCLLVDKYLYIGMIGITNYRKGESMMPEVVHSPPHESQTESGSRRRCFIGNILSGPTSRNPRSRPAFWPRTCLEGKIRARSRRTSILIVLPTGTDRGGRQTLPRCKEGHTGYCMKRDRDSGGRIDRETTSIPIVRSRGRPPRTIPKKARRFQNSTGNWSIGMVLDRTGSAIVPVDQHRRRSLIAAPWIGTLHLGR